MKAEAVRESLKNMVLVMYTSGAFTTIAPHDLPSGSTPEFNHLWDITWERLDGFMPNLKKELFPAPAQEPVPVVALPQQQERDVAAQEPSANHVQAKAPQQTDDSDIIDASSIVQAI